MENIVCKMMKYNFEIVTTLQKLLTKFYLGVPKVDFRFNWLKVRIFEFCESVSKKFKFSWISGSI